METSLKKISELASVINGFSPKPNERKPRGQYLLLGGRNIKDGKLVKTAKDSYVDNIDRNSFKLALARPGDIVVSTLFDRRKIYVYTKKDPSAVVNNSCAIIRSDKRSDYIVSYLRTYEGQKEFVNKASKATGGAFIPRLSVKSLSNIQIPILPFPELKRLGDANIESSTKDDLIVLKKELEAKESEIERLKSKNDEIVRFYEDRINNIESQIEINDLATRIKHGETVRLEFKSSLRWNIYKKGFDNEIENSVLKTIAAFCNTNGGELLIGVADNSSIVGIQHDLFKNSDKFLLHLRNLISDRIIGNIIQHIEYRMVVFGDKAICSVNCKPSKKAIWFKADKKSPEQFFVRLGPSSTELTPMNAVEYIDEHFK